MMPVEDVKSGAGRSFQTSPGPLAQTPTLPATRGGGEHHHQVTTLPSEWDAQYAQDPDSTIEERRRVWRAVIDILFPTGTAP